MSDWCCFSLSNSGVKITRVTEINCCVTLLCLMELFAFFDVMVKDLRDFLLIGLLDDFGVFKYFLGLILGMKVSDEDVLIHLSTLY